MQMPQHAYLLLQLVFLYSTAGLSCICLFVCGVQGDADLLTELGTYQCLASTQLTMY
jgi:hypothetical protein